MKSIIYLLILGLLVPITTSLGEDSDWPQWRGPQRDGWIKGGPKLAESFPRSGPPQLWSIDDIPASREDGGYSSPVISKGRLYLFLSRSFDVELKEYTIDDKVLRKVGWVAKFPSASLIEKIEKARTGSERRSLSGRELRLWVNSWIEKEFQSKEDRKFRGFASNRFWDGNSAIDIETLKKLGSLKGKTFSSDKELEALLDAQGISRSAQRKLKDGVRTSSQRYEDVVLCLNAHTGDQIWKRTWPGGSSYTSSTLIIQDGKCFGLSSSQEAFCLDLKKGDDVWRTKVGNSHSSPLVHDGKVVFFADNLVCLNSTSGDIVWRLKEVKGREGSPVLWTHNGEDHVIIASKKEIYCVTLEKGELLWKEKTGGMSTPSVVGDQLVFLTDDKNKGLTSFKLTKTGAEKLWFQPDIYDRGASVVVKEGYIYGVGENQSACVKLSDGSIVWKGRPGRGNISSPIIVKDKLISVIGGKALTVLKATPEKYELLNKSRVRGARCVSPSISGGKLYIRLQNGLSCFDLRAKPEID